jgi:hypothetical protein
VCAACPAESTAFSSVLGVACILVLSTILLNYAEMTAGSEEPEADASGTTAL